MAGSLNKVMVIGNVGRDPEMRYTPNGSAVANFSVAASRSYSGQDGERHEETEWFSVVCWNRLAETVSQYVQKGKKVYIEGRLQTRNWDDKDGQKHYRTEVVAERVLFLDRADGGMGGGLERREGGGGPQEEMVDPEDLPF
jgi:single-strand DNA-binding protein